MNLKQKLYGFTEEIIVVVVMFFIFLPVRVFFTSYVSDNWFGSFGVISAVVVSLVLLSKYNKLGIFGRMYWKTITKLHKGKRRIISYTMVAFMIYFWGASVAGVNFAESNPEAIEMKVNATKQMTPEDQKALQNLETSIEQKDVKATSQELQKQFDKIPTILIILSIPILLAMPFIDMTIWAVLVSVINDFTNGWYLHFSTVFFVEGLEVAGIMIYTFIVTRTRKAQT